MSQPAHASGEYLKNAILTAGPEQLQLMLYDGAIRFTLRGIEAIEAADHEAMFNALERAQRIVLQMHAGLNRDANPVLVDQMAGLYTFIYKRLVDAHLHRDTRAAQEALRILRHQRETWTMLIDKLKGPAGTDPTPATSAAPPTTTPGPAPAARSNPFASVAAESTFSAEV